MSTTYFISVFLHIVAAAFWIGGMLFLIVVLLPAIKNHPERSALFRKVAIQFRIAGYVALFVLLITGLFNMHARGISLNPLAMAETFQGMMGLKKLGIFMIIITINWIHDRFTGEKALQKNGNRTLLLAARWLGRLNLLLALAAVILGMIIVRGWIS